MKDSEIIQTLLQMIRIQNLLLIISMSESGMRQCDDETRTTLLRQADSMQREVDLKLNTFNNARQTHYRQG